MPGLQNVIEPTKKELIKWFKNARIGDWCHVVTREGQTYMHLTKFTSTTVKWKVTGFTEQNHDLSKTIHVRDLLEIWDDFSAHTGR